jgi:hypothetical protein
VLSGDYFQLYEKGLVQFFKLFFFLLQQLDDFSSNEKRHPDYKINVFHSSNIKLTNIFSEVKIKSTSETGAETSLIYFDLYRLMTFLKKTSFHENLEFVLSSQFTGKKCRFHYFYSPKPRFYVMKELDRVSVLLGLGGLDISLEWLKKLVFIRIVYIAKGVSKSTL